ncbi:DHA2 family efflux MFS transporter permease subunit [Bacillaceae bacterium]
MGANDASYKWFALMAIVMGAFVAVLNNSLINVALPEMMNIFGTTTEKIQWVLTAYMLTSGIIVPISGYLGDTFGYKRIYVLSLIVFTLGALLCGLAWSVGSMIVFRIIQGLGGGMIMPVSMSIIYKVMPREQIGIALGLWGIALMVAPAVGPTLSGYLIEYFSWRFLFYLNVPIGVLAIAIALLLLRETERIPSSRFDFAGFLFSTLAAGSLLLALSEGYSKGWTSLYIVSLFVISFFSFLLFVWTELNVREPMIDLRILRNPVFTISTITSSLVMIGMFGGIFLTPIFLQNLQGFSAIDTGLLLLPQAVAMGLMMPVSGRLFDKIGAVPLGLAGLTILGVTTFHLHTITLDMPAHTLSVILAIRGIGIGICMMPLTTAGMNAVEPRLVGRASALGNVARQVSASLAIAVLTTIMNNRAVYYGNVLWESVSRTHPMSGEWLSRLQAALVQLPDLHGSSSSVAMSLVAGMVQKEALSRAIADTYLVSAIPVLLAIPLVFFLRKRKEKDLTAKEAMVKKAAAP